MSVARQVWGHVVESECVWLASIMLLVMIRDSFLLNINHILTTFIVILLFIVKKALFVNVASSCMYGLDVCMYYYIFNFY